MIDQVPVWAWWVGVGCLVAFTAGLLKLISWFLSEFIKDNKTSWTEIKLDMKTLTTNISELVIVTNRHNDRIEDHSRRLNHHDEDIIEFRKKI